MCAWHDPSMKERVAAGRVQGGAARSNRKRAAKQLPDNVLTIDQLRGYLGLTLKAVLAGKVEPGVANAVANLSRSYAALTEAAKAEELTARLDDLERLAARGPAA